MTAAFDPKIGVRRSKEGLRLLYDQDVFGPEPELRRLHEVRPALRDPQCSGPDPVYAIYMDVGLKQHQAELHRRMLLFGVVVYAAGQLGAEPVRSQGHIHAVAPHCGWSPPEIFEIWEGRAIIYAQQVVADDPGSCVAIYADPGDKIVVPPGWAHYVVNADCARPMVFAAWCDRQYGFLYDEIRKRRGLAWFPILETGNAIRWEPNPNYRTQAISTRVASDHPELNLQTNVPIYHHFAENPESLQWVSQPSLMSHLWDRFEM